MALLLKVSGCFRNKTFAVSVESTIKSYRTSLTKWMRKPKESKIQWALAASGVTFTKLVFDCKIAKCQVINSKAKDVGIPINNSVPEEQKEKDFPWIQFLTYIWPHIFALTVAIVSALAVAILNTKIGISIGSLVNVVSSNLPAQSSLPNISNLSESFLQQIKKPSLDILKLYISHAAMTFSYIYSLSIVGERVASKLRSDLFSSILKQDIKFFDSHKSGEITSRLSADVQEFKSSFKTVVSQGLRCLTQTIGSALALYHISPQLSGIMMVVVPSVIFVGTAIGSLLRKLSKIAQAQTAKAMSVADEAISNVRTVRAFAMEDIEMEKYETEISKAQKYNELLGLGIGIFQSGTMLFLNGIVLSTLYYGGYLLAIQELTPGDLMAFLVSTQTIQRSLGNMSLLFGQYVKGLSAGSRVFEYINIEPTIPIHGGKKIAYHNLMGEIAFNHVSFTYPTRPDQKILQNFNLSIPGGKIVAIVGTSGSGKSTAASLLERFYDSDDGSITIDKVNIKSLDPNWLRGQCIGYINQEPTLFNTTIMENIRYGRPDATDVEVYEAAQASNCHNFIQKFPDGYNTIVGERGVTVSGGQKQRIAIARALIKNPSILVLDEATSALDSESEQIVQEALDSVCKGRTVLVIAHRLSTIRNADIIAVLKEGQVAEIGTHSQLKKFGGIYSKLIEQQDGNR